MVNNPTIPKFFTYHEIHLLKKQGNVFQKFAHQFHSLKITFENIKKVKMNHVNIFVGVNDLPVHLSIFSSYIHYFITKSCATK